MCLIHKWKLAYSQSDPFLRIIGRVCKKCLAVHRLWPNGTFGVDTYYDKDHVLIPSRDEEDFKTKADFTHKCRAEYFLKNRERNQNGPTNQLRTL